jgi:CRISPR-associated protein Csb2
MSNVLSFVVSFLDPEPSFHGRTDGGDPEWPPSPLRLFQAIVDAAAKRWRVSQFDDCAIPALTWLEQLAIPTIVAPPHHIGVPFRIAVPNNDLDVWAGPLSKGKEPKKQPNELKSMKLVRTIHLRPGRGVEKDLNYLYPLSQEGCPHLEVLKAAARSVTHLGWGIDMVAADATVISQEEADKLPGHRWRVVKSGGVSLRVPKAGTLQNLMDKHKEFLGRLSKDGFKPVRPLSCFDVVQYHSPTAGVGRAPERPIAAFEIHRTIDDQELHPGKSRFRPFHHVRRVATVAGMVRYAAAAVAKQIGHPEGWVNEHVLGHGDKKNGQSTSDQRLMFLPMPSIQPVVGVGGIRRVLVVGWPGCAVLADICRRLNGAELIDKDTSLPVAVLSQLAKTDPQVQEYTGPSKSWNTVTPVILPGHDDPDRLRRRLREQDGMGATVQKRLLEKLDTRILALLRKAFHQAGWTADALAGAELEYRPVGWRRGLEAARNYELPRVSYPRFHVRVTFRKEVRGPLVIGAGRYRGFGLFAVHK